MTIIRTSITQAERLDLMCSNYLDDRLRGYSYYPVDWFITCELKDGATSKTVGILMKKSSMFGQSLWGDNPMMNVYLPFEFEGHPVKLK